jgi:hypothetical protein
MDIVKKLETSKVLFLDLCEAKNRIANGLSILDGTLEDARVYSDKREIPEETASLYLEFEKQFREAELKVKTGLLELEKLIDNISRAHRVYTEE